MFIIERSWNLSSAEMFKILVSKGAKIRNRYIQVPHLTQDTNGKNKNNGKSLLVYDK